MKKAKYFIVAGFSVVYAAFIGLLMEGLLNLFSIFCGVSLDTRLDYPRLLPFCVAVSLLSLVALVALLIFNIIISEKFSYTKRTRWIQMISAFVLSIPTIKLFEMLFDFLEKIF